MNKFKLTHSLWARILAFVLIVVDVLALTVCLFGVIVAADNRWYTGKTTAFEDSFLCRELAWDEAREFVDTVLNYGIEDTEKLYQSDSFSFKVINDKGRTVYDNTTDDSVICSAGDYWYSDDEECSVECYVNYPLEENTPLWYSKQLWDLAYRLRNVCLGLGVGLALVFVILLVFLLVSAGHVREDDDHHLLRQDKLPLDFHLALCCVVGIGGVAVGVGMMDSGEHLFAVVGIAVAVTLCTVAVVAFLMTFSARVKAGKWWRNSIIYRVCKVLWRLIKKITRGLKELVGMLPLTWKTALGYAIFLGVNCVGAAVIFCGRSFIALFLLAIIDIALLYCLLKLTMQLRELQKAGRALAQGQLDYKVDTEKMLYDIKEHGDNLNNISVGMGKAVEERMKSERFKTELITNVSHDLKTPLTSIVSYVDLLKKEKLDNPTAEEYVQVLDRQSAKLKKLTEDLVDASKASSGAVNVVKERINAAELLQQTVAEYGEKLAAAGLEAVVTVKNEQAHIMADGRLLWRVLDNLMQNVCKYSMTGTRVYMNLVSENGMVDITIKNISAKALNIPAEELMERFVRGDEARSTEGSGLGLSIANSLTELQGGCFEIALDGDLFKTTVTFPEA